MRLLVEDVKPEVKVLSISTQYVFSGFLADPSLTDIHIHTSDQEGNAGSKYCSTLHDENIHCIYIYIYIQFNNLGSERTDLVGIKHSELCFFYFLHKKDIIAIIMIM